MPKPKKVESEHSFVSLEITGYSASVDSSINYEVRNKREPDRDTKVFSFDTHLEIKGRCTSPEETAGAIYSLFVYASTRGEDRFSEKLDDYHVIDDKWQRVYRKAKDRQVPVYQIPKGIGHVERKRGTSDWSGGLQLPRETVTDMLILLPHVRPLYLSINCLREGKVYFITHFSLQTNDPAES